MQTFEVRQVLLKKQTELEARLDQLDVTCHYADGGTQRQQTTDNLSAEQLTLNTLQELRRVKAVLQKVGLPGYGFCSRCGHTIGTQKLSVLPNITICTPCEKYTSH